MNVLATAWSCLGEDPAALALVHDHAAAVPLTSRLAVGPFVHDAVAAASLSAALLAARRAQSAAPLVELDPARVATAVTSEKHFRLAGEPMNAWAELSGFWRTSDGWVRTHANYPHHRARLLDALGLDTGTTADVLREHLVTRERSDVEERVTAAGGIAVAVRTEQEWAAHDQHAALEGTPLIGLSRLGDASRADTGRASSDAPAAGIRVLDLTRVIAGPVASRTLALWGADVLRVDPPGLDEPAAQYLDTGAGKRSIVLDAASAGFGALLDSADVVLTGYRPGALHRFGLDPVELALRRPGIIVARLGAWGARGPWAARRGFDSIVQAATGIALAESTDAVTPGVLPAQALDHSAGYLLAAGITSALRRRIDEGGSWLVETSLARIAEELLAQPRGAVAPAAAPHYDGGPDEWSAAPGPFGSSRPEWLK